MSRDEENENEKGCQEMASLYIVSLLVAVTLTCFGLVTDQFRGRDNYEGPTGCLSAWGYRSYCDGSGTDVYDFFHVCTSRAERLFMSQWFYLPMFLGMMTVALLFGLFQLCCYRGCTMWFCLFFNLGGAAIGALGIALMVDSYYNYADFRALSDRDDTFLCEPLGERYTYGPAFVFTVIGYVLNIIASGFLLKT